MYIIYIDVKEYIIIGIAIYKMKHSQALLRISCTKLYYEFPVQRGKKYMLHTKVGNKGWKAEKRADWQKKSSKPSEKLTTFSLHVNDGKRLVTCGTRGDPERKRIMTPAYLRNTRPVHPFGILRSYGEATSLTRGAIPCRRRGIGVETSPRGSRDDARARVARLQPASA